MIEGFTGDFLEALSKGRHAAVEKTAATILRLTVLPENQQLMGHGGR